MVSSWYKIEIIKPFGHLIPIIKVKCLINFAYKKTEISICMIEIIQLFILLTPH